MEYPYAQLHAILGSGRSLLAEGPLVVCQAGAPGGAATLKIGDPQECEITWFLTTQVPSLKVAAYTFMFAVPHTTDYYAIDFVPGTPQEVIALLEKLLQQHTAYAVSKDIAEAHKIPEEQVIAAASGTQFKTTRGLATNIASAGVALASGIAFVGDNLTSGIVYAGKWFRARSEPRDKPVNISPTTMRCINTVRATTKAGAGVAVAAADKLADVVGKVAGAIVPSLGRKSDPNRPHGVVSTSVVAVIEVLDSMYDAGKSVVNHGVEETATCVEFKYGDKAGEATRTAAGVVEDFVDVYGAYRSMRTRAIAKAAFKGAVHSLAGNRKSFRSRRGERPASQSPARSDVHMAATPAVEQPHAAMNRAFSAHSGIEELERAPHVVPPEEVPAAAYPLGQESGRLYPNVTMPAKVDAHVAAKS